MFQKYSEDKDKHILQENERIKLAYEAAVKKAHEKAELVYKDKLEKLARGKSHLWRKLQRTKKSVYI